MPAVAEHPSDVPDRLRALGLGVVASIDGLAYQLHLALSLRNRYRGFPQRPRPGPDCPSDRLTAQEMEGGFSCRLGVDVSSPLMFFSAASETTLTLTDAPQISTSRVERNHRIRSKLKARVASFASFKEMVISTPPPKRWPSPILP